GLVQVEERELLDAPAAEGAVAGQARGQLAAEAPVAAEDRDAHRRLLPLRPRRLPRRAARAKGAAMISASPVRLLENRRHGTPGTVVLPESGFRRAKEEIASWPGYAPTPLLDLPDAAQAARVAAVHYKDEAGRFGLGSFKALGGAYAVAR